MMMRRRMILNDDDVDVILMMNFHPLLVIQMIVLDYLMSHLCLALSTSYLSLHRTSNIVHKNVIALFL